MTSGNAKGPPRVMIRHTGRPGCFLKWRLGSRAGTQPSSETVSFEALGFASAQPNLQSGPLSSQSASGRQRARSSRCRGATQRRGWEQPLRYQAVEHRRQDDGQYQGKKKGRKERHKFIGKMGTWENGYLPLFPIFLQYSPKPSWGHNFSVLVLDQT